MKQPRKHLLCLLLALWLTGVLLAGCAADTADAMLTCRSSPSAAITTRPLLM